MPIKYRFEYTCDHCLGDGKNDDEVDKSLYWRADFEKPMPFLHGWIITADGRAYCPDCFKTGKRLNPRVKDGVPNAPQS